MPKVIYVLEYVEIYVIPQVNKDFSYFLFMNTVACVIQSKLHKAWHTADQICNIILSKRFASDFTDNYNSNSVTSVIRHNLVRFTSTAHRLYFHNTHNFKDALKKMFMFVISSLLHDLFSWYNNNIVVFCDDTSNRAVGILQVYTTLSKNLGQNIVIFCDKTKNEAAEIVSRIAIQV